MLDYTVLAVTRSGAEHAVCLADAAGGFHVARATARVPQVGAKLLGSAPRLGFGLLLGVPIDEVFRVIFERVHCSRAEAHHSLHGSLHP
jgi:hypothetical protein